MDELLNDFEQKKKTLSKADFMAYVLSWCSENEKDNIELVKIIKLKYLEDNMNLGDLHTVLASQVAGLETEAETRLFIASFQALTGLFSSIFTGNSEHQEKFTKMLMETIAVATQMKKTKRGLENVAPSERPANSETFLIPKEEDLLQQFLGEIHKLKNSSEYNNWWVQNKTKTQNIVKQKNRDILFNALRARRELIESGIIT